MKKTFLVIIMLCCELMRMSADEVKVTMKSGSTITGELKELVATDHVTIIIAGVESVIPMTEVSSIEKANAQQLSIEQQRGDYNKLQYGTYEITETKEYPEVFLQDIDGQVLTMILVKGGVFNMGYDGRSSLSMKSEPVHQVTLSSFYVSKECVSKRVAMQLIGEKAKKELDNYYHTSDWEKAKALLLAIADKTHKPYRMITEAEWEYASLMPYANVIFGDQEYEEWCFDFFGEYESTNQINPKGPSKGEQHVTRSFNGRSKKWDRQNLFQESYVRVAIDADQIQL